MTSLDLLRWDAECLLAREGWTDRVAAVVWGLRFDAPGGSYVYSGRLDAERLLVEPGRLSGSHPPSTWAIAWAVPVLDDLA